MIEAIVFDMDGILFDTERLSKECWEETAAEMNLPDFDHAIISCIGLNRNDIRLYLLQTFGKEFPYDEFFSTVRKKFDEKLKQGIPLMRGTKELLDFLSGTSYKVGLASSSTRKSIISHLEESGLTKYFESITGGDMVEHSKPLPDIYLMACKSLNVSPEHAIAVEDSPNGIRAAFAANMKAVMVPDLVVPSPEIEAMLYKNFDSLVDFKKYLENI